MSKMTNTCNNPSLSVTRHSHLKSGENTAENDELVTDRAKVTGCDGLPVFNWRRFQLTRKPAIIRHYPSPVTNSTFATESPCEPALLELLSTPVQQLGAVDATKCNAPEYSGSRFAAGAAYDPTAAREYAETEPSLTPEHRAALLAYADEIEKERAQTTAQKEMAA